MKQKDLMHFETVCALFSMCHCLDDLLDEITEEDLPETLGESYQALKTSIRAMLEGMEQYRDAEKDTFMSACED